MRKGKILDPAPVLIKAKVASGIGPIAFHVNSHTSGRDTIAMQKSYRKLQGLLLTHMINVWIDLYLNEKKKLSKKFMDILLVYVHRESTLVGAVVTVDIQVVLLPMTHLVEQDTGMARGQAAHGRIKVLLQRKILERNDNPIKHL